MASKVSGVRKKMVGKYPYWIADLRQGIGADGKRVRKLVYCKTQSEAVEVLRENLVRYGTKKATPGKAQLLSDYLANWVVAVRDSVQETTHRSYKATIELHVLPLIEGIQLGDFSGDDIRKLYSDIRRSGSSPSMVARVHGILRIAMNAAVMERAIPVSPLTTVKAPTHRSRPIAPLTAAQTRAFLAAAKGHRLYALFAVALAHGLREGELFGLTWADVDFEDRTLLVRRSVRDLGGTLSISTPKGGKYRTVQLGALAAAALAERQKLAAAEGHGSEFCFTKPSGSLLRVSNFLRRDFAPLLEKAKLAPMRFHDLRHTAASLALLNGVSAKIVQEQLGHSDVALTLRTYTHSTPSLHRDAAGKMDALLAVRP
jgi:integrase